MKKILLLLGLPVLLFSCKPSKKNMLLHTWHAVDLQNKQMDTILMQGQHFIDTIGQHTDAAANLATYGTNNLDSLKKQLQIQLDTVKTMQDAAVKNTVFEFRKDSVAILNFSGKVDSTKWYLDDEGNLMLDEMKEKGAGDKLKMQILALSDTMLQLQFVEGNSNSVVTFHPAVK